jgi:hypothetical protein
MILDINRRFGHRGRSSWGTGIAQPGKRRRWVERGLCVALVGSVAFAVHPSRVLADASAPPPLAKGGADCPLPQYPPAGYGLNQPRITYEVPFVGKILDGQISLPSTSPSQPTVLIPHIYAAVCGVVELPDFKGLIKSTNIYLATTNVYVGSGPATAAGFKGLEALPIQVGFGDLDAQVALKAAANGGLNISLAAPTTPSLTSLGMTCSLPLPPVTFTTGVSGAHGLTGRPVTGPTHAGTAEVVSNDFAIPPVATSKSCPASIAATFNKLLGLPAAAGRGMFTAPFTFDFELTCKVETPQVPCSQQPSS